MIEYFSALVEGHGFIAILASLGIGILTSLAPCSIAGIPLVAGFAANVNIGNNEIEKSRFIKKFTFSFVFGVIVSISLLFILMTQFKYALNSSPIIGFVIAGLLCFYVALSAFGIIKGVDFHHVAQKFVKFRLIGAFIMGMLIGVVSSPCATPAIASILIVAQNQSFLYSLFLIMAFALGHSVILIISGLSINFVQYVSQQKSIGKLTSLFQNIMALGLIIVGGHFLYQAFYLGVLL